MLKEMADYGHVTKEAISMAIKAGKLKAIRKGKVLFLDKAEYDEYRSNKYNRHLKKIDGELIFDPQKGTFSVQQAAKLLAMELKENFSYQRVYYLIKKQYLTSTRASGQYVLDKQGIYYYIEKRLKNKEDPRQLKFV